MQEVGMYFCSKLNISNGMYRDVLALFKMYVNTQFKHLSSEEFAQFSAVGTETKGWEDANVPSAPSADPHNAGI